MLVVLEVVLVLKWRKIEHSEEELSLSLSLSVCRSVCWSVCLCLPVSLPPSVGRSVGVSVCLSVCLSLSPSLTDLVDHTILQPKLRAQLNNPSIIPSFQSYLEEGSSSRSDDGRFHLAVEEEEEESYLASRSQNVGANGKLSAVGTIQSAVSQSSIIRSPLLCK